ncbi:hypothetical protein J15TS10_29130 [Paenibacillus woosongensis]|uniref:Uncharacterized protein n=1 Tax=Paenibacillus woosongensis TaxID=307580 RepID=A0ABQ4MT43_9BACL|nr:hypothetical protein J15TS10_29130 [Paenibacillus woosongensis]
MDVLPWLGMMNMYMAVLEIVKSSRSIHHLSIRQRLQIMLRLTGFKGYTFYLIVSQSKLA